MIANHLLGFVALSAIAPAGLQWEPLLEPGCGGAMTDIAVSPHQPSLVFVAGDMLGVGRSTNGGDRWGPTFGLQSYEMASFSFHPTDPKVVWVGSMAGPYLSRDGGLNWQLRRNGMPPSSEWSYTAPVEQVLFDPLNPKRLLAYGGSSRNWEAGNGDPKFGVVWQSTDEGANWTALGAINADRPKADSVGSGKNILAMSFAPKSSNRLYALVLNAGFYRSDDGGRTWTRRGKGLPDNARRLVVHPTQPQRLYVSTGSAWQGEGKDHRPGGVFESTDGGETFQPRVDGLAQTGAKEGVFTSNYPSLAISPKDPNVLATSDAAWNTGVIYLSRDGGKSWAPSATKQNHGHPDHPKLDRAFVVETAMSAGLGAGDLAFSPTDPQRVYAINSEWIVRTTDGGRTWTDSSSERVGEGWKGRGYTGWCTKQAIFDPFQKGRVMVQAMDAGRAWVSQDGMKSWRYGDGFPQPWMAGMAGAFGKGNVAWGAYGQFNNFNGVGKSSDGGRTWTVLAGKSSGLPEIGQGGADPQDLAVDPDRPNRVMVVLGGDLYGSEDGRMFRIVLGGRGASAVTRTRKSFVLATRDGLYEKPDDGKWRPIGGPKEAGRVVSTSTGDLIVAARGERPGVWRRRQGAWTRLLDERLAYAVAADPKDPRRLLATTAIDPYMDLSPAKGIWASSDDGKTWSLQNAGLAMLRGHCIAFDPHGPTVIFGSYGRGFFRAEWPVGLSLKGSTAYVSAPEDAAYAATPAGGMARPIPVRNGNMELGTNLPEGWDQRWVGSGELKVSRDTTVFHAGSASLRVEAVGADPKGQASQMIEAGAGTRMKVVGWLRTRGRARVNLAVQPYTSGWSPISFEQAGFAQFDTEWTRFEKVVTLPAGAARFGLTVLVEGPGTAWLDDVTITPEEEE